VRKIDRQRERNNEDFDPREVPVDDLNTKNLSLFQVEIRHQGKTSTLFPDFSLLGMFPEMFPLQSLLPTGR